MAKLSATAFNKAMSKAKSVKEQNQTMETCNVDIVDLIEQVLSFTHPLVPPVKVELTNPKNVYDVQKLTTTAAARLRVILEAVSERNS